MAEAAGQPAAHRTLDWMEGTQCIGLYYGSWHATIAGKHSTETWIYVFEQSTCVNENPGNGMTRRSNASAQVLLFSLSFVEHVVLIIIISLLFVLFANYWKMFFFAGLGGFDGGVAPFLSLSLYVSLICASLTHILTVTTAMGHPFRPSSSKLNRTQRIWSAGEKRN